MNMSYAVKLDVFEGPLDLLLHLIRKNEIDIYNIPISLVTEQYLDYLKTMRALSLDVAGEYLVLAATLIHIKSRLLIPLESEGGTGVEDDEDPRMELVEQLVEYQKYKSAAENLGQRSVLERDVFTRGESIGNVAESGEDETEFKEVSLFELIVVFQELLKGIKEEDVMEFAVDRFSLIDKVNEMIDIIKSKKSVTFMEMFEQRMTKRDIVRTFMALLELIKLRLVRVYQASNFGAIRIFSLVEE